MKKSILLFLLFVFGFFELSATNVNEPVNKDTTWTLSGSPYIIQADIVVEDTKTLTIEAGVEVKFDGNYQFTVNGELIVQGTSSSWVVFTSNQTSPAAGDWRGIHFSGKSDEYEQSDIDYLKIQYAATGIAFVDHNFSDSYQAELNHITISHFTSHGISIDNSKLTLQNIHISNPGDDFQSGNGMRITSGAEPYITGGKVQKCDYGISIVNASPELKGLTITDNASDGIYADKNCDELKIVECYISGNSDGIRINSQRSKIYPEILRDTIISNRNNGIYLYSYYDNSYKKYYEGPVATIQGNVIYGNGEYQLNLGRYDDNNDIWLNAENNWWGSAEPKEINEYIYDHHNAVSRAYVDFVPFLDSEGGNEITGNYKIGPITQDETWSSHVVVVGDIYVQDDYTLSIMSGVQVSMSEKTGILVTDGHLQVNGSVGEEVAFNSYLSEPSPGDWRSIEFTGKTPGSQSQMDHFVIEHSTDGLKFTSNNASSVISNGRIRNFSSNGIYLSNSNPSIENIDMVNTGEHHLTGTGYKIVNNSGSTITGGKVQKCDYGISIVNASPELKGLTIIDNASDGIYADKNCDELKIVECYISGNSDGIRINSQRSKIYPEILRDTIISNRNNGIYLYSYYDNSYKKYYEGPVATIQGNVIYGNGEYQLNLGRYDDNNDIWLNAENNWWGETDSVSISNLIYDHYDNSNSAYVDFIPFDSDTPAELFCYADFNYTGRVDGFDLAILAASFGSESTDENYNKITDINQSNRVDGFDLALFGMQFGHTGNCESTHKKSRKKNDLNSCTYSEAYNIQDGSYRKGDTIIMDVVVHDIADLYAYSLDLSFNTQKMDFSLLSYGKFLEGDQKNKASVTILKSKKSNWLTIGASRMAASRGVNGTGNILKVKFIANENIRGIEDLIHTDLELYNSRMETIQVSEINSNKTGSEDITNYDWIFRIYPNPVHSNAEITYYLNEASHVSVKVYSLQGKLMETIVDHDQPSGQHKMYWNIKNGSAKYIPGIYLMHFISDIDQQVEKVILLE